MLDQSVNNSDTLAQVILGADDKHLQFRSCVAVRILSPSSVVFSLDTRVRTLNAFGQVYLKLIDSSHRNYIAPTMLAHAVSHVESLVVAKVSPVMA